MNIDLAELRQKLVDGEFIGFTLAEESGKPAADKTVNVKMGLAKMALTKLGGTKTGLVRI